MDEKEHLFLKTYEDIEKRLTEEDSYGILQISALIRKLLLDDSPLVDQVNRNYKKKIIFEITQTQLYQPGIPAPDFFSVQDGLDPDTSRPGKQKIQINRDNFFKTPILLVKGKEYSIKDIIQYEAHVMGGVHAGSPKSDKDEILKKIENLFVGGYRPSLRQLKAIARVVLKAIKPLKESINV